MPRNIRVFLIIEAIMAGFGGFILPIYVLYFRYYHMTLFEIALLASVFEGTVLLAEIPTGLLADRFGRRLSVGIGFGLYAVSGLVFITNRNLAGFLIAEVLFGLAEAFISGAAEALAVDSIPEGQKESMLRTMYTWRTRIRIAVTSGFMIVAGYLFALNISITFYPVLIGGLAGLAVSFFFARDEMNTSAHIRPKAGAPLGEMIRQLKLWPILRIIFIISLAANFSFEAADQYWQVLFSELFDINIKIFGWLTAAGAVLAFLAVGPFLRRFSGNISLPLFIMLMAGVVISSLPNVPAVILPYMIVLYFAAKQLIPPLFSVAINRIIGPSGRATFLSGYNMTCSAGEVTSGLLVGLLASRAGLPPVFVITGGMLVLSVIGALFYTKAVFDRQSSK
jgi:DHA1 family quinolone resistance protein-like MFS transporter